MICASCHRDNDPRRRYCGKCGFNFQPVCRRCSFVNDRDDRFCGGCGALLVAAHGCTVKRTTHEPVAPVELVAPPVPALPPPAESITVVDELGGLFGASPVVLEPPSLPEAGIAQDDLDRLFGGAP